MMNVIYFHYLSRNQIILSSNIKVFHKSLDFSVTNRIFSYTGVHGLILIDLSLYVTGVAGLILYDRPADRGTYSHPSLTRTSMLRGAAGLIS